MKTYQIDLKNDFRMIDIEKKFSHESISDEEISFITSLANQGIPRAYFILGKVELIQKKDEGTAMKWFDLLLKHGNQYALFRAANFFAMYDEIYMDQAMKFLRRAAWRQHPIAKRMLKYMKINPFTFPKA